MSTLSTTKPKRPDFGATLRAFRRLYGLSQADLAYLLDAQPPSVSEWERNKDFPRAPALRRISEFFRIPWSELAIFIEPLPGISPGSFAHLMRLARYERGLTVRQVADVLRVDPSTVTGWENGRVPKIERVDGIAQVYGLDRAELLALCPVVPAASGRKPIYDVEAKRSWAADHALELKAGRSGFLRRLAARWGVSEQVARNRVELIRSQGYLPRAP